METAGETIDPTKIKSALASLSQGDPVARPLRFRLRRIEEHLSYLESWGCGFDFNNLRLTVPLSGGRPRFLYRDLVEALSGELGPKPSRKEKIAQISPLLEPFFVSELVTTGSKDRLARTIDNAP